MVTIRKIPFFRRQKKKTSVASELTLVAASYQGTDEPFYVTLQFDRAIDITGIDGSQITLKDGEINGRVYQGTGSTSLTGPATVQVELVDVGPYETTETLLTATDSTGIIASDDGGGWGGCTNLEIPFP